MLMTYLRPMVRSVGFSKKSRFTPTNLVLNARYWVRYQSGMSARSWPMAIFSACL